MELIGFDLPPEIPTGGNLMTRADDCIVSNPILAAGPGCIVTLTVMAVFFIDNALREALDGRCR